MNSLRDDKNMQLMVALFAAAHCRDGLKAISDVWELLEIGVEFGRGIGIREAGDAAINTIDKAMEAHEAGIRG